MEVGPGTREMKTCVFLVFSVRIVPRGNVPLVNSWGYNFQLAFALENLMGIENLFQEMLQNILTLALTA